MTKRKGEARIRKVVDALRAYEPESVYLFGSWARGEADDLSDLDLVVIKRTMAPFFDRLVEVGRLLPAGTGGVDVLVYTPDEFAAMQRDGNAFAEMIAEEGRLIYARESERSSQRVSPSVLRQGNGGASRGGSRTDPRRRPGSLPGSW